MPTKHKWEFKSYFRREAYGWNGTAKASKRMREAVSEIKKIAKKDSSLAGEGVVELFVRLYPALMQIDSSSGALGTAMNKTINALIPVLIKAEWDMNTRGKWLDKLFTAIQEDGWGTFDDLRGYWGELCVFEGLAHIWADRLIPTVKQVLTSDVHSFFAGTEMCLSCLLFTERYDELKELIELKKKPWWTDNRFWAMALQKQGKNEEALEYAEQINLMNIADYEQSEINDFCEQILIDMGRIDEAYQKYGLIIPSYGTNLNIFRSICKKYPTIDKKKILLDCIEKTGGKGKWFASAKNAGFLDIAVECALSHDSDPNTLLRACRDYADKDASFALLVGVMGIIRLVTGIFYDEVTIGDVSSAYNQVKKIAKDSDKSEAFKALLAREMLKQPCDNNLRDYVVRRLEVESE